jgi:hypothetical protein
VAVVASAPALAEPAPAATGAPAILAATGATAAATSAGSAPVAPPPETSGPFGVRASPSRARLTLTAHGGASLVGAVGGAAISARVGARTEAVLAAELARGDWYLRGIPTAGVTRARGLAGAKWILAASEVAALELTALGGALRIGGPGVAWAGALELGARAVVRVRPSLELSTGLAMPVALTADGDLDHADQRLHAALALAVARDLWLTAEVFGGGAFGYDGDGEKLAAGAAVGVKYAPTAAGERLRAAPRAPRAFVATEYRALGLAGHVSQGVGFAVGADLLRGRLRVGLAGFGRPGPMNRATFLARPVAGQMWNGQSELALRSDGNFLGLHAAPALAVGRLRLALPVTVGQAGFGFYLHGADRRAVMGERVSAVENRLFAGKDSSFALGAEVGLAAELALSRWAAAYAAVHYLTTVGYAALDRDSYRGPSAALGVAITP